MIMARALSVPVPGLDISCMKNLSSSTCRGEGSIHLAKTNSKQKSGCMCELNARIFWKRKTSIAVRTIALHWSRDVVSAFGYDSLFIVRAVHYPPLKYAYHGKRKALFDETTEDLIPSGLRQIGTN